jgi:alpha-tubulin suppressor-like RCC1 family protein
MATPAQRTNTWMLDEWYDQSVAGTTGGYQWGGQLWSWGYNRDGSLGLNGNSRTFDRSSPTQVGTDSTWKWLAGFAGYNTMAGKRDGTMWGWGKNESGLIGYNLAPVSGARSSPMQVGTDTNWKYAVAGTYVSIALKTDGTIWTCGFNHEGKMGINSQGERISSPTQVGTNTDWKQVNAGRQVIGGIKTDGTLWMWGGGSALMWLTNTYSQRSSPVQMPGTTWKQFAAGQYSAGGIKTDGTLWMWGDNGQGTLGLNKAAPSADGASSPIQVGTDTTWDNLHLNWGGDNRRTMATKTDGTLWIWGSASNGQLGLNQGGTVRKSSPTQIPGTWATATPGVFDNSEPSTISCEDVTACKRADGSYYIWGRGVTYGGLGLNDRVNRSSPTQLPGTYVDIQGQYGSGFAIKE